MFENIVNFFKKIGKKEEKKESQENSKDAAKERLHLVLMQDRANVSADFLELMKQEIIDVIKKYIEVDEKEIDVRLTNKENEDGTNGAPALYANIPILNIKNEARKVNKKDIETKKEHKNQTSKDEKANNEELKEEVEVKEEIKESEQIQEKPKEDKKETIKKEEDKKTKKKEDNEEKLNQKNK
ncbi:MAG: cell division topological specificity factor MinE [Clostridia bacterium]|nr:cell division topological specificity factor MinE [Clostridia bacterium]